MAKKEKKNNNKNKENNKNKKSFFKGFKAELKKVIWPTPKQLVNNTVAVITIVLITAAIVFVLDLTFESINKHGVDKIKEVISTTNETSEENITENSATNETANETESEENSAETENTENTSNTENTENAQDTENVENNTANSAE